LRWDWSSIWRPKLFGPNEMHLPSQPMMPTRGSIFETRETRSVPF
jgi:hypothetical protein